MSNYNSLVDELGIVKARIAELEARENELKAAIVAKGVGPHEGQLFRATVSKYFRETLDLEAVREKLSPQFLRAHTTTKEITKVNVVARTGVDIAA